jgi:alpha-L-rhamnosidase
MALNGRRVGDHVLDPGFTQYDRRILYVTHDVTDLLTEGTNAIGVTLGNGLFNAIEADAWGFETAPWRMSPRLLLQLEVDGRVVLVTDGTWRVTQGPTQYDFLRTGEVYDARQEIPAWATADLDISGFASAAVLDAPAGRLVAQNGPPMRITRSVPAVSCEPAGRDAWLFDLGENIAGVAEIRLPKLPAGTEITLEHSDFRDADGQIDFQKMSNCLKTGPFQTDRYIAAGRDGQTWRPRFCYHGFQWVRLTGLPDRPDPSMLTGKVIHTDFPQAGTFQSADETWNRVALLTRRSYVGNFHSIPTDCPQREKNGWTGDAHLAAEYGLLAFGTQAAYEKWLDDLSDAMADDGSLPGIVPTGGWGFDWGNGPAWDAAYALIAWYIYLYRGDDGPLRKHYPQLKRYVEYAHRRSNRGIASFGLGDWVPPFGRSEDYVVPLAVVASGYYLRATEIAAGAARRLGRHEEADRFDQYAAQTRNRFADTFVEAGTGLVANGTAASQATAIGLGLIDGPLAEKALDWLCSDLQRHRWRVNAGIHATKCIYRVLADAGRFDVIARLLANRDYPSYGWWIDQGATTLWENWNGEASRNHIMFGDISALLISHLAGIGPDPEQPGMQVVRIRPQPQSGLDWAKGQHDGPFGPILSEWQVQGGRFELQIEIPPGSTARVEMPTADPATVTESGRAVDASMLAETDPRVVLEIPSGRWNFACPYA